MSYNKKKKDEPLWCKMFRDEVLKPAQKKRITEQKGRTLASRSGFYNKRSWKKLRDKRIRNNPVCQTCEQKGIIRSATIVDHIIPLEQAPDLALEYDNTQSLCDYCHIIKTSQDRKEKARRIRLEKGKKLMDELEKK